MWGDVGGDLPESRHHAFTLPQMGSSPVEFCHRLFGSSCCPLTYILMAFAGAANDPLGASAGILINIMAMALISLVFHGVIASRLQALGSKL